MKKIGLYGGSFDPVHFGHLNLALEMIEKHQLDEVCFMPALLNPNKFQADASASGFASAAERLKMLSLALEGVPGLTCSEIELQRKGPSYTVDTLKLFIQKNQKYNQFFLILGEDAAHSFPQWREPEEIIKLAKLLVGSRPYGVVKEGQSRKFLGSEPLLTALHAGLTETRVFEISASDIRKRLAKGLYCGHLIPAKVMDYIISNQLYC